MRHADDEALERLGDLLVSLRALPGLKEVRPGVFYRRSRAFLHFHVDPAGLFADVRLVEDGSFERHPATSLAQRRRLLAAVRRTLAPA